MARIRIKGKRVWRRNSLIPLQGPCWIHRGGIIREIVTLFPPGNNNMRVKKQILVNNN